MPLGRGVMSAHGTAAVAEVRVQVGGIARVGRYRTDSGVLTVWYGSTAKSVRLKPGPPEFQAGMVLVDMVMREDEGPRIDPRD